MKLFHKFTIVLNRVSLNFRRDILKMNFGKIFLALSNAKFNSAWNGVSYFLIS